MAEPTRRIPVKRFQRTAALALLALAGGLVFASQASAERTRSSVREYVYITHRAPAPPLGTCIPPSDSDSSSAFALAPWQIGSTLNVTRSTQNVPVGSTAFANALNGAIAAWEGTRLPNSAFGGVVAQNVRPRQRLDGQNVVGFGKIGSAVGVTRFWVDTATSNVVEFDTLLNSKYPWSTAFALSETCAATTPVAFDVQAVLTHELGHPVGLEHFDNDVQTMYPFVATGETRKRTLAAGDTNGATTKYQP
jgi:Matrixin